MVSYIYRPKLITSSKHWYVQTFKMCLSVCTHHSHCKQGYDDLFPNGKQTFNIQAVYSVLSLVHTSRTGLKSVLWMGRIAKIPVCSLDLNFAVKPSCLWSLYNRLIKTAEWHSSSTGKKVTFRCHGPEREQMYSFTLSLTSALNSGRCNATKRMLYPPGQRTGTEV